MRLASCRLQAMLVAALALVSTPALASGPLEYPDNGTASFSRGGAWVATATEPIAAHYNPAALPTQASGMSLDLLFAYNNVCYRRRGPGNAETGPTQAAQANVDGIPRYSTVCNETRYAPRILPSVGIVWRVSDPLAFGFAVVPPATYGGSPGEWPTIVKGRTANGQPLDMPAPYRFMTVGNRSTILHPTFSFGYEIAKQARIGAGFIWSVAVIDVESFGMSSVRDDAIGDEAVQDSKSTLRTQDLFVPGFVIGFHSSATDQIDVGLWARWLDAIDSSEGELDLIGNYYDRAAGFPSRPAPLCTDPIAANCPQNQAVLNRFRGDEFQHFRFVATPPEIRLGVRFHVPRALPPRNPALPRVTPVRDPLAQDVFDVELDGSYTLNGVADVIEVRLKGSDDGRAIIPVSPTGNLPPRADRPTGYMNSVGARLGGQYNLIANTLGLRAGTWLETESADPAYLNVAPVAGFRGGYGGGIVIRHERLDVSIGYQHHWNKGLNNNGNGKFKAGAGVWGNAPGGGFKLGEEPEEQQFRTFHAVNGGQVTQSANVFAAGATYRF